MPTTTRRSVIVTGSAFGIGRETAIALGQDGCRVILCDIARDALQDIAARVADAGGEPIPMPLDLRDAAATIDMVAAAGRIDAIVHSAGLFPQLSFADSTLDAFDRVMAVNLRAAFVLAKAGADAMATGGGSLVFLTSGAGLIEMVSHPWQRDFALYGASKAALDRWALGSAHELAARGIAVTTITPGAFVRTAGTAGIALPATGDLAEIAAGAVGRAVAWLAREPRMALAGRRLSAMEFGDTWGA